jgi:hypothetical protein
VPNRDPPFATEIVAIRAALSCSRSMPRAVRFAGAVVGSGHRNSGRCFLFP